LLGLAQPTAGEALVFGRAIQPQDVPALGALPPPAYVAAAGLITTGCRDVD
jgi:hypothetical protein